MRLTYANVQATLLHCLFTNQETGNVPEHEVPPGAVTADGILCKYAFHPERLAESRDDIRSMLSDLADDFMHDKGGGMSFLNACMTKDGEHWGEHPSMDVLFALGSAAGFVSMPLPRNMWNMLPGGMPYYTVKLPQ